MDIESFNRRLAAIENKQHVNYSSISGVAYKLSFNGTSVIIESDGSVIANNVIVADNLAEDNEEIIPGPRDKI